MNSVVLIGRLARDPELRYTPSTNTPITQITVAVDRPTQQGQERQADFIRVTVFGRQAETVNQFLRKGRQVAVQGRIQTGSYKNRDGQTVYTTDVVADRVEFLGGNNSGGGSGNGDGNREYRNNNGGGRNYSGGGSYGNGGGGSYGNGNGGGSFDSMDEEFPDSFQATDDDIPF